MLWNDERIEKELDIFRGYDVDFVPSDAAHLMEKMRDEYEAYMRKLTDSFVAIMRVEKRIAEQNGQTVDDATASHLIVRLMNEYDDAWTQLAD